MEFKISQDYKLPDGIFSFNYEELKTQIIEKTEAYTKIVYTDENIKAAKEDRAELNRFKKALNDERIRIQKDFMKPFDDFKKKVDDLITIIDKPVLVIDKQIKEYEAIKQDEKRQNIEDMFKNMLFPEFVKIDQVFNSKWLNATCSMAAIEKELLEKKETIRKEVQTLASLPKYSNEAVHFYQKTLDISQSLGKVRELTEVDEMRARKEKEEAERKAQEEKAAEERARAEEQEKVIPADDFETAPDDLGEPEAEPEPEMWVSFQALLTKTKATQLKEFFECNNIQFKPIQIKGDE